MTDRRKERMALNEAAFRVANERMSGWPETHAAGAREPYLCECADPDCRDRLDLDRETYERVRADSVQFVVLPGHEMPDAEDVIERGDGFTIVRKHPDVAPIVRATDPRR